MTQNDLYNNQGYYHQPDYCGDIRIIETKFSAWRLISLSTGHIRVWLYIDTKDAGKVANLASNVFWLVIPSLVFFISLPVLLKKGVEFYLSMGLSMSMTVVCYLVMVSLLIRHGIKL